MPSLDGDLSADQPPNVDPDDTSHCPRGHRCESCGTEHAQLAVHAVTTPLGVLCLTLCPECAESDNPAPIAVATAVRLVAQHAQHLAAGGAR